MIDNAYNRSNSIHSSRVVYLTTTLSLIYPSITAILYKKKVNSDPNYKMLIFERVFYSLFT
jgi:hypothetical protein